MGISMHEINSLDDLERALGLNTREGREANREETGCKLLPEAVVEHLKEANKQFTDDAIWWLDEMDLDGLRVTTPESQH